ncbi:MAG: methyltransferase domain-containing protein [Candidatus Zixiibacteriota bacterium]
MKSESFFDKYAHEYNILTNAQVREKTHREEVRALVERFHPAAVLDAGCAVGLTSRLFAEQGVSAVGLDRSRRMISEARRAHEGTALPIRFQHGHFEKLPRRFNHRFDLVVCLANSISGVGNLKNLRLSLQGFRRVLRAGGVVVIQALNLAALKDGEIMPVRATQAGALGYLRFARRQGNSHELTVVRLDLSVTPFQFEVFSHKFDSFTPERLESEMKRAGFAQIRRYSDLAMSKPFRQKSRDIVLVGFA